MDEALIRLQEEELRRTGRYYKHICFLCVPLLCVSCYLYGLRPLLLCGFAVLMGNLCDQRELCPRHRPPDARDGGLVRPRRRHSGRCSHRQRGLRRLWQLPLPPRRRGLRGGGSVLAGAGLPLSGPIRQYPALGRLRRGHIQHHLGHPAQRRPHQHQRPVAGAGRVCRPDGDRCSHRAGGLRPLPLDAEGCAAERLPELPHHGGPHRLLLPAPAGPDGGDRLYGGPCVPPALCARRDAGGRDALQRRLPAQ